MNKIPLNQVFYHSSADMHELHDNSVDLIITSQPYFNIKDYTQNTTEFIIVYVKDGKPRNNIAQEIKEASKLSQKEWVEFTKQIWDLPTPNKSDSAFGKHSAIMHESIPYRPIKLFSFVGDIVLDPFAGSGTTLKVAKELGRNFVGYEIYPHYATVIDEKLGNAKSISYNLKVI